MKLLVLLGKKYRNKRGRMPNATVRKEMSFSYKILKLYFNLPKNMLKETLTILFTVVFAHQTRRIDIHDPASEFYTNFS